jgi:hypothetical protein
VTTDSLPDPPPDVAEENDEHWNPDIRVPAELLYHLAKGARGFVTDDDYVEAFVLLAEQAPGWHRDYEAEIEQARQERARQAT